MKQKEIYEFVQNLVVILGKKVRAEEEMKTLPNENKELNKWQIVWRWTKDYRLMDNWYSLVFGVAKFYSFPADGEMISRKYFKGQIFELRVWLLFNFSRF